MTPLSYWFYFHAALVALMAVEYLLHRRFPSARRKAVYATVLWTAASLVLAVLLIRPFHSAGATQYLAGYFLEESLSIDNLFVFLLLFRFFRIADARQPRVLFWGVAGAIVFRGAFVFAGVNLLNRFHWIGYFFGALLLVAAIRLLKPEAAGPAALPAQPPVWIAWLMRLHPISDNQDHFFVREPSAEPGDPAQPALSIRANPSAGSAPSPTLAVGNEAPSRNPQPRRMATILLLALIAVELSDVVFALDSIPAVLSITRQPFLAYTSNIMAVMGLRSLYILLAAMLAKLRFLHLGLAAILAFAAIKMLLADRIEISPAVSLAVIAALVALTVAASIGAAPSSRTSV